MNASQGLSGKNVKEIVPEIDHFSQFSANFSFEITNEMGNKCGRFGWSELF